MGEPKPNTPNTPSVAPPNSGPQIDPLLGRTINERFTILSLIARGGMGKVYKAEQAPLGRLVALKVLHPNYTGEHDPEFHKRFFLEASTSSKLRHPNTVTIFDYGTTDDGVYYMAMELLEGRTLHRLLREVGRLPYDRALRVLKQMCRSLREAHGMGVIHRDLKPANVFLVRNEDDEDFVKVLDFGLVKQLDETGSEHLTQTGLFMGSPKYMAPEQIRGERVTAATDVYALGVVLFEMLTGKVPFDRGNSVNTLMAHVSDPIPALQDFAPDAVIPVGVAELVYKCLKKNPDDRFATMDALLDGIKFSTAGLMNSSLTSTGEFSTAPSNPSQSIAVGLSTVLSPSAMAETSPSADYPTTSGRTNPQPLKSEAPASPAVLTQAPLESPSPAQLASIYPPAVKSKPKSKAPIFAVISLVIGITVATAVRLNQKPVSSQTNTTTQTQQTQQTQQTTNPQNNLPHTVPTNPPQADPGVHIIFSSEPSNVEVLEGSQSLGHTPLDLRLASDAGSAAVMHTFTFRLAGYVDAQVTLGGSEIRYNARLARRPRAVPPNQNGRHLPTGYREW